MSRRSKEPTEPDEARPVPTMDDSIVEFGNPPVAEVVCGIGFDKIRGYSTPQMGLFWNDLKKEFPRSELKLPLPPPTSKIEIQIGQEAELLDSQRYFLRASDGSELVQLQEDRFLYNWIRTSEKPTYPRYKTVVTRFNRLWGVFNEFLDRENLGSPKIRELRLQYVNHVEVGEGWHNFDEIHNVFPSFRFDESDGRYLPTPSSLNISMIHSLPIEGARMEITIRTGRYREGEKANQPLLIAELLVIGNVNDPKLEHVQHWFDQAREAIDRTFVEMTSPQIQKEIWGRVD